MLGMLTDVTETLYAGMATQPGIEIPRDGNAGTGGLYFWPNTIDPVAYKRSYARTGHWLGLNRSNYDLVVNSSVTRIEFDGDRASGLSFIAVNSTNMTERRFVKARKEVILAAGTIHTPQILQLSGIGPAAILSAANITQKVDLPGVGENFQDHGWYTGINFNWTTPPPLPTTNSSGDPSTSRNLNLGAVIGLPVFSPAKATEIARTYASQTPAQYLPNTTHPHVLAGYAAQKEAFSSIIADPNTLWMWLIIRSDPIFGPANQHPFSRGSVHINASDPAGPPVVDYRAFSNPLDIAAAIEMLRFIRRYMAADYFAAYGPFEVAPGAHIASDAQLEAWMRRNYVPSVYHPVGTAAKMPRELGGCG
ncbi:FAD-linked reductase [Pyrenochaeta sp. DS3sAY3a]|nr:FAD-linked reductase [Pyrenochaeta sp. DS3sAY3a]